jgi:hypothetical protein
VAVMTFPSAAVSGASARRCVQENDRRDPSLGASWAAVVDGAG